MIRAILFDLDNTLYPHLQYVQGAFREMAARIAELAGADPGRVLADMLATWQERTQRYGQFYRNLLEGLGIWSEPNEREIRGIYHSHVPTLRPFDGVPALLRRLGETRRLGLLTDGWAPTQRRKLAALGLEPLFHAVLFTGDLGEQYYKPHPRGYRMILEPLAAPPAAAVFVGDNPDTDIRGAREAGLWTVRILQGEYRDAPDNDAAPPHRRCTTPTELPAILADLERDAAGNSII
jgi:putative hydrolase of the HAD superfamily